MGDVIWHQEIGGGPLVAVANHAGRELRHEVAQAMLLPDRDRLREEDPFTDQWTKIAPTRLVAFRSRFEVDLNRPRELAVYTTPEQSWGLQVWRSPLPSTVVESSLQQYDAYYENLRAVLREIERIHGRFVVLDLHSYNHRRGGPGAPPDDPTKNPQVNIGTGTMNRARWATLVDRFISDLSAYEFPNGRLDVRENVKFYGLNLPRFVHENFPESGCVLAVEFKKFFMDEWTGDLDRKLFEAIGDALASTVSGLMAELSKR